MARKFRMVLRMSGVLLMLATLTACNTLEGMERDVDRSDEVLEDTLNDARRILRTR